MFGYKFLLALTTLAVSTSTSIFTQAEVHEVYNFDPQFANGIKGQIKIRHGHPETATAIIEAHLDFSKVDFAAIQKFDANCVWPPTEYKYHIHVDWTSKQTSDSFVMCALGATGNHYDPLFACGPNSQNINTDTCKLKLKTAPYGCNPTTYATNPFACEKGDISGKFGAFKLDNNKKVSGQWTDNNFPFVTEISPKWSIVLHAVCNNNATPRIACAQVQMGDLPTMILPANVPATATPTPKLR